MGLPRRKRRNRQQKNTDHEGNHAADGVDGSRGPTENERGWISQGTSRESRETPTLIPMKPMPKPRGTMQTLITFPTEIEAIMGDTEENHVEHEGNQNKICRKL